MIGLFELGLIAALALIVLGPQRMLVAARYCGLFWRKFRVLYTQIIDELDQQLRLDEMARHHKKKNKPSKKETDR